ncbi:serine/arginine repetitive matrix protein 1-like [Accipiter gentilis]|uniref:serine/arginine repetitive matrix protein 1-like n=1 Tax=Astur gentilis TaxID=8957 RepID=UPI00210FCD67|nr:serine/arginine repetitive matrix protein 1-like [Accipiter gentilis]
MWEESAPPSRSVPRSRLPPPPPGQRSERSRAAPAPPGAESAPTPPPRLRLAVPPRAERGSTRTGEAAPAPGRPGQEAAAAAGPVGQPRSPGEGTARKPKRHGQKYTRRSGVRTCGLYFLQENRPRRSLGRRTRWGDPSGAAPPPPPSTSAALLPPGARSRRSSPELYTLAAARDGLGPAGAFGGKPVKIAENSPSSELRGISLSLQGSFSRLGKRLCFFEKIPVLETFLRKPEGSGKTQTHRVRTDHSPYPSHRAVQGKHVHPLPPNPPPLLLNSTTGLGAKPPPWQMPPQEPAWLGCKAVAPLSPCPSLSRSSNCCCIYPN